MHCLVGIKAGRIQWRLWVFKLLAPPRLFNYKRHRLATGLGEFGILTDKKSSG